MEDIPYIRDPAKVRVFPGVADALRRLQKAGYAVVMVTNQSAIGRGWSTLEDFERVQARFLELVGRDLFDGIYMCPDAPEVASQRRKPAPGMIYEAADELGLDLARSWMIGDKASDVECGLAAGLKPIQVQTGEGAAQRTEKAFYFAETFADAADFIVKALSQREKIR